MTDDLVGQFIARHKRQPYVTIDELQFEFKEEYTTLAIYNLADVADVKYTYALLNEMRDEIDLPPVPIPENPKIYFWDDE